MRAKKALIGLLIGLASPSLAADRDNPSSVGVASFGARCDGVADDTNAFKQAITRAPSNGTVMVPTGRCVISDTLVITPLHPVSFTGSGRGSQIFMKADKTLFDFQAIPGAQPRGIANATIKDLFLGSLATSAGTALIALSNSKDAYIDNVTMLGSYYGLYLKGAQSSRIIDLRSGVNFAYTYFAAGSVSSNQYWVYGDRFNGLSTNDTSLIAPQLEGGVNGLWLADMNGEGGLEINGGTIEGVSGTGIELTGTRRPTTLRGLHFEANRIADIVLQDIENVSIAGVVADRQVSFLGDTRRVRVDDSQIENLTIDLGDQRFPSGTGAKHIHLQNISTCFVSSSDAGIVPEPVTDPSFGEPNGPSSPVLTDPVSGVVRTDIVYLNIGKICGGG